MRATHSHKVVLPLAADRPTYHVPLSLIRGAEYNHPGRSDKTKACVQKLAKNIAEIKQRSPVHLAWGDHTRSWLKTIDGHNRVAAHDLLGLKAIWAVIDEDCDPAVLYAAQNEYQRPLTANQKLWAWLRNTNTVTAYLQQAFTNMVRVIGLELAHKMANEGKTLDTYKQARSVAFYCDVLEDDKAVRKILHWLIDHHQTRAARHAIDSGIHAGKLLAAIISNRPFSR